MIKTFDINHQILFENTTSGNQIFFKKNKKIISDSQMRNKFLEIYQLSEQDFLNLADEAALKNHMLKIEQEHGCNPGFIHNMGIVHLSKQKEKHLEPLVSNFPNFKQELIRQSQEWVQQYPNTTLPILEFTKSLLNTPMFKNNIVSQLDNTLLVLTQQGFSSVEPLVRSIIALGFNPSNIILFTKPHTTSNQNQQKFEDLQTELGIHYISPPSDEELFDESTDNSSHPNYVYKKTKKIALNKAINKITSELNRPEIKNVIIHDEGGIFSKSEKFQRECLIAYIGQKNFTMSEHTMSGIESSDQLHVQFPCFSMAQSWLKTQVESFFIAEKSFLIANNSIEEFLEEHDEVIISIVGLGNIGSQFAKLMIQHAKNYQMIHPQKRVKFYVNDTNPKTLELFMSNDFHPIDIEIKNRHDMFSQSNFLFGCTGKDISIGLENEAFDSPHHINLMSISSGNREFETLLENSSDDFNVMISQLSISILNEGRPIIFREDEDDAIHPSKIQIIRAMTLATIFQQLNYLAQREILISSNSKENALILRTQEALNKRFIDIDAYLQQELWEAFKIFQNELPDNLMINNENLKFNSDFLSKDGTFDKIMSHIKHSRTDLKIDNSKPHAGNYICQYDQNHDLHIIEVEDHLEFIFLKNGVEIIQDPYMDSKKLAEKRINPDNFYRLNSICKSETIKNYFRFFNTQTLNQTPGSRTAHYSLRTKP